MNGYPNFYPRIALVAPSPAVHKAGQIWNCYISINISARASIKSSKYLKYSWLSCWYIQLPVLLPVKSLSRLENGGHFINFFYNKHSFNLTSAMRKSSQIMQIKYLSWWWRHQWRHGVTSKLPSVFMFSRGSLREQVARVMSLQCMWIS